MIIDKVKIENFKCFEGIFEIKFNEGINIIVGNNEAGKSTILEAIHLTLTGILNGRNIKNELSQYLFNSNVVKKYLEYINLGIPEQLPCISIEVYFAGELDANFIGDGNSGKERAAGVRCKIAFVERYNTEYETIIKSDDIKSLPIEYYDITWQSFAREQITTRSIPIKSALIDSSNNRYQNGADIYISRIIKDNLETEEITNIAQAHRKMKESFMGDPAIVAINEKINQYATLTSKKVELSVEMGTKNAWESSLITQLNEIPFNFIGKGEQCIVKTELALSNKKAKNAGVILLEEPENHLSHTKLNQLISCIKEKYINKQIIVSTHNSFVANKLGLDNLILLNNHMPISFSDLKKDTKEFFEKISGYDTLRLILCKKAILVEGDSDELVIQKAYMDNNCNRLPIEDGIEVMSVGISFLRFLEISEKLHKKTAVVTDNDSNVSAIDKKYKEYLGDNKKKYIDICVDRTIDEGNLYIGTKQYNYNTLEPKILKENSLEILNDIFNTNHSTEDDLRKYMKENKTECSLRIFKSEKKIIFPEYIMEAIKLDE